MFNQNLKNYSNLFDGYTELRVQENTLRHIQLVNGNLTSNTLVTSSGVSSRVYKGGAWGFSSNPNLDDNAIKEVIKAANNNAHFLASKMDKQNLTLPIGMGQTKHDFSTTKNRKIQKELLDFLNDLNSYIDKKYTNLISVNIVLSTLDMRKNIVTSDGATTSSMIPRTTVILSLSTDSDSGPVEHNIVLGGLGQFEDTFSTPDKIYSKIDETYSHLMKKREGVFANAGITDCILGPKLAGILAHEAIGHTAEADFVLGGSIAGEYMNQKVASEMVTLVDFANTALGKTCPVPLYTDDEGVEGVDAVIIENGILKNYMHNKESAKHFDHKPTGNARAFRFSDEPLIRMRNTAILPGTSKINDMIASIDNGYYLIDPSNGQADSTSEFMFGVTLGYEIKNGKLGHAIKDTTISGVAFDMLKTVTMLSDDMVWLNAGMCGKKQPIPVGMGGPAIKCKIKIGGK